MARGLVSFDRQHLGACEALVGIDEAGRGALAGPVVAAAVRLERRFFCSNLKSSLCLGVDDSKRLKASQRAQIVERMALKGEQAGIAVAVGVASVAEIERFNILQATVLAMRRAFAALHSWSDDGLEGLRTHAQPALLIDGRALKSFPLPHRGIVGGDRRSFAIALAGIHAKEARDATMRELCSQFPDYGFSTHKGYGTPEHLSALRSAGPCPLHRSLFVRKPLQGIAPPPSVRQDSLFQE